MSTQSRLFPPLQIDAARAAETTPIKSSYRFIGDHIEKLLADVELARLAPSGTQSVPMLGNLALITVFQFVENLPDHRAAETTRTSLEWKYALHLPRTYPSLEPSLLCGFRRPLIRDLVARQTFQQVLDCLDETELLQNLDEWPLVASEVLATVCGVSRLERLIEAMHLGLEALAALEPDLLRTITLPHWYERYGSLQASLALPKAPKDQAILAQTIGVDALYLSEAIARTARHLAALPEMQSLQQIWFDQFDQFGQQLSWRTSACAACYSS